MFFKKYRRKFNSLCGLTYSKFTIIDASSKDLVKIKHNPTNIQIHLLHKDNDVDVKVKFIRYYKFSEVGISDKVYDLNTTVSLYDNNAYEKLLKSFDEFVVLSNSNLEMIKSQVQSDKAAWVEKQRIIENNYIRSLICVEKISNSFLTESDFIKDYLYDLQDILGEYNDSYDIERKSWQNLSVKFERIFTFRFNIDSCNLPSIGDGKNILINEEYLNVMKSLKDFSIIMDSHDLLTEYVITKGVLSF